MPPINAVVSWNTSTNLPVVAPDPIIVPPGNGATVIHWTGDSSIVNFQITGLDASVFNPSQSRAGATVFNATDSNNNAANFSYNVTATHTSGLTAKHDPRIENGGGGVK